MRTRLAAHVLTVAAVCLLQLAESKSRVLNSWFTPEHDYKFVFSGDGSLRDFNFTVQAPVFIRVFEEDEATHTQELLLTFDEEPLMVYSTVNPRVPHVLVDLNEYAKWFSVVRNNRGNIVTLRYPRDETTNMLNFKRMVATLLSFDLEVKSTSSTQEYDSEEVDANGKLIVHNVVGKNSLQRTATADIADLLYTMDGKVEFNHYPQNIALKEHWTSQKSPFTNHTMNEVTTSFLLELKDVTKSLDKLPPRPTDLITNAMDASFLHQSSMAEIERSVSSLVQCILSSASSVNADCSTRLTVILASLPEDELYAVVHKYLVDYPSSTSLVLLKSLIRTHQSVVPKLIAEALEKALAKNSVNHVSAILSILPSLRAPPSAELVGVLFKAAGKTEKKMALRAYLVLGVMARKAMVEDPELSESIVTRIKSTLKQHTGVRTGDGHRSPRSAGSGDKLPITLLDALGNAGSPHGLDTLVDHATEGHAHSLDVVHSAVIALRKYNCEKSADVLLNIAGSDSAHLSLRHTAANLYLDHPRARRGAGEGVKRAIEEQTKFDVAVPTVRWSERFGEHNMSTELNKLQRNSFSISADNYSTDYQFSLFEDTWISSHLELSGGDSTLELFRTQLCYEGTISFGMNMLRDFYQNYSADTLADYTPLRNTIVADFNTAVEKVVGTGGNSSIIIGSIRSAASNLPTRVDVSSLIQRFNSSVGGLSGVDQMRMRAETVAATVNRISTANALSASALVNGLTPLVDWLATAYPASLLSHFSDFPEVDTGAPLRTLNEMSAFLWRANASLNNIELRLISALELIAANGVYGSVVDPTNSLYDALLSLSDLKRDIQYALVQDSNDDSTILSLEALQSSISSHLDVAIETLRQSASDLVAAINQLRSAFSASQGAFRNLVHVYEVSRSEVDIAFGLRFNTSFPNRVKSCDSNCGCGGFPTTIRGQFNMGIDLVVSDGTKIYAPVGGVVTLSPPKPMYGGSVDYDGSVTVQVLPNGDNLRDHRIVIGNVVPDSKLTTGSFIAAGATLGEVSSVVTCDGMNFVHLEMLRSVNGTAELPVDPTPFLQPILEPTIRVNLDCNSVAVLESGNVVDRMAVTGTDPERVLLGEPLITDLRILPHEFPQPADYVLRGTGSYASSSPVTFTTQSTSIMVGPNVVNFDFSAMGSYSVNVSATVNILSRNMEVNVEPSVSIEAVGSSQVGNAVYSRVTLNGGLFEGGAPSSLQQNWTSWPLEARSSMDLVLAPSTVTLTSTLLQQTGLGEDEGEEVLQADTLWQYSIPPVNREEYIRQATVDDMSAPVFTHVFEDDGTNCTVRQLPWRLHDYPAFELDFRISDLNSLLTVDLSVTGFDSGETLLRRPHLRGSHVTGVYNLTGSEAVHFALTGRNSQGLSATSYCTLSAYDRSPPLARITPSHRVSSHPSQLDVLVVLFDEYGLEGVQQVAVGTRPGEQGSDVVGWMDFSAELLTSVPPSGSFSFKREGVLTTNIIQVASLDKDGCERECLSDPECLSYDHSELDAVCVLHNGIEGPSSANGFENSFRTPPLRSTAGFYHYEKLGVGHNVLFNFTELSLQHGRRYFVNTRLVNKLGYRNVVSSTAVLVDFTPPEPGLLRNVKSDILMSDGCNASFYQTECLAERPGDNHRIIVDGSGSETVFNGPISLVDEMYTTAYQIMSANWNGFHDDESGIMGYSWCIGTAVGMCDVYPFEDPHRFLPSKETWTNSALARLSPHLEDGDYFVTVRVESDVEYGGPLVTTLQHCTPYRVDTVHPQVLSAVLEGYITDVDELRLSYSATDDGSGLDDVSVAIGTSPSDSSLLGWTSIPLTSSAVSVPVTIPNGVPGFVKIRATDKVGLSTVFLFPDTLLVDRTPPLSGNVRDGSTPHSDLQHQANTVEICVNFDGFDDPETGISAYIWTVLNLETNAIAFSRQLTMVEMLHQAACEGGLTLTANAGYYSSLTAVNGAVQGLDGSVLNRTASSDGVYIDVTPPVAGVVRDGLSSGEDLSFSSCFSCVQANWDGFADNESDIDRYQITVNHKSFDAISYIELYTFTINAMINQISLSRFNFHTGDSIKVAIRAWNGAGLSTVVESSGFVVDLTPPSVTSLQNEHYMGTSGDQFLSNTSSLTLTWEASDAESGLKQIKLVMFQVLEGEHVQVHPPPYAGDAVELDPTLAKWTVDNLTLTPGASYVVVLEFVNGAGLSATRQAPQFTVDTVSPVVDDLSVVGGERMTGRNGSAVVSITTDDRIEASWVGRDADSGVFQYKLYLRDELGVSVLPGGGEFVTLDDSQVVVQPLSLTPGNSTDGPFYVLQVVACDQAGLTSEPVDVTIFVGSGPSIGYVTDGENPDEDVDHTHNTATVSAHFSGFHSSVCGGVQHYTWSIGNGTDDDIMGNVLATTTRGLSDRRAQVYLGNLRDHHGVRLYVTVIGYDGCDGMYKASSDGFIIDETSPTFDQITVGGNMVDISQLQRGVSEHNYFQTDTTLNAIWKVSDPESGLEDTFSVRVGTFPGGSDIIGEYRTRSGSLRNQTYVPELEGIPQFITLVAVNKAGLRNEVTLPPVVMDTSPPVAGKLSCPMFIPGDPCNPLASVSMRLTCSWSGFHDTHSPVSSYSIMIGSSPGNHDLLSPILLPQEVSSYSAPILEYSTGIGYYVTLTTTNSVGLRTLAYSSAIFVESTPPQAPQSVNILANYLETNYSDLASSLESLSPSECILESDSFTVEWEEFIDTESNISHYQISSGRYPGADDIIQFTTVSPTFDSGMYTYTVSNIGDVLRGIGRDEVYVNVRAFNGANMASFASTKRLFVSTLNNADASWVWDGCRDNSMGDIDYQISTSTYCGYFHIGTVCPLRSAEWALEATDGELVQPFVEISNLSPLETGGGSPYSSNTYRVSSDQLALYHNETYRLIVRAFDVTGRRHLLRSDGVFVTIHPLQPGWVRDGLIDNYDLKYQVSTTSLSAHWSGFGDGSPEQEVEFFEIAVGTDRRHPSTKSNIVPFTNVGVIKSYTFEGLNLVPQNQVYFVTVRAHAVSTATAEVTSNGVTVGFNLDIVPGELSVPPYQSDHTSLSAYWSEFESDVPIRSYQWGITPQLLSELELKDLCSNITSDYAEKLNFTKLTDIGLNTAVTVNISLESGLAYYFVLRVVDQGSKCLAVSSSGTIIDTSPPTPQGIFVGSNESRHHLDNPHNPHIAYLGHLDDVQVAWEAFEDYETPMDHYEIAVFQQSMCGDTLTNVSMITPYQAVELDREHTFTLSSVSFEPLVPYMAVIKGFNMAGRYSMGYSHPFVFASTEPSGGDVKDGLSWEDDRVYQSSTSELTATWAHSLLRPTYAGGPSDDPCPSNVTFSLDGTEDKWSAYVPTRAAGIASSTLSYQTGNETVLSGSLGTMITMQRNGQGENVFSGAYRYPNAFVIEDGDSLSLDIAAATGEESLQTNSVTSVVFFSGEDGILPQFDLSRFQSDPEIFQSSPQFSALGFSLYNRNASGDEAGPKVVLWYYRSTLQSVPTYASAELLFDVATTHKYTLKFEWDEQDFAPSYWVNLYVDGQQTAVLHGIQSFTEPVDLVLSLFNQNGFLPSVDATGDPSNPPAVRAIFSSVAIPLRTSGVCRYGRPMHSWENPFVRMEAGIGTAPYLTDVKGFQVVSTPCVPCLPGPCESFSCNVSCADNDPYTVTFTFPNLTLPIGSSVEHSLSGHSQLYSSIASSHFIPAAYYVTVRAVTTSGASVMSSSNGVIIDTSPPVLVSSIEHFDVAFNPSQPVNFQGSNDTISTSWEFRDEESGIVEYLWGIGTRSGETDVQALKSVGLDTSAMNSDLLGILTDNETYYITVVSVNGAGLRSTATSSGVTYVATELNVTELTSFVRVLSVEPLRIPTAADPENVTVYDVATETDVAGVSWNGVPEDVDDILWSLGSEPSSSDILPSTRVSYSGSLYAEFRNGMLYINGTAFASLAQVLAIAETREVNDRDNLLSVQPGSVFYHTLEFCNVAHKCERVVTQPGIVIRNRDYFTVVDGSEDISANLYQMQSSNQTVEETPIPDREATIVISATDALSTNSTFAAGILSDDDLKRYYRTSSLYISNPYTTMGLTGTSVSRRFTSIGGPSFYISFLGDGALSAPLEMQVSFDRSVDWMTARPTLLFWDTDRGVWREVNETCVDTPTQVDWATYTLTAYMCSSSVTNNARRKRQAGNETVGFLERPTHFIVGQIGSAIINTPPRLQFPSAPFSVQQHPTVHTLDLSSMYTDDEMDSVLFYLLSTPRLGTAELTTSGHLTYIPCHHCIGLEELSIRIVENSPEVDMPLSDSAVLLLNIVNSNDAPEIFFYDNLANHTILADTAITVNIDNRRVGYTSVALIGGYDFDGYHDDLTVRITGSRRGTARGEIWLDAVGVSASLPVVWPEGSNASLYHDHLTFIGVNITYLPSDPTFVGSDTLTVTVRDSGALFSDGLTVNVVLFESPCRNGGRCEDPIGANCTCDCPSGYTGSNCEVLTVIGGFPSPGCPEGVPMMTCDGDPCSEASCPSHPSASCVANYCGGCRAEWFNGGSPVQCNADQTGSVCNKRVNDTPNVIIKCNGVSCDCPQQPFACPADSILKEIRVDDCCVQYECVCPNISCPLLMECGRGVQPHPSERGHGSPGYCCPAYDFEDIDECSQNNGLCSSGCRNNLYSHQCTCESGVTLADDSRTCGVCHYNSLQYFYGDRVRIGCNWCECVSDAQSQERWQCTNLPCVPGCLSNGQYRNIGDIFSYSITNCTCSATDTGADWDCTQLF